MVNKVMLLGRLGKDPELRYTTNQTPVSSFSLATSDRRKDATGNWVDTTEWHNIVVYGKSAENCHKFLKKGRESFIEGKIQTRKWQDKEGKDRYTTEIIAFDVRFIGGGRGAAEGGMEREVTPAPSPAASAGAALLAGMPSADQMSSTNTETPIDDDDIPF